LSKQSSLTNITQIKKPKSTKVEKKAESGQEVKK